MKTVEVHYMGALRDMTGVGSETIPVDGDTYADVFEAATGRHDLKLDRNQIRAGTPQAFRDWSDPLDTGVVYLMPPSAGG